VNLKTGDQYHVQSSVTHQDNWCPDTNELRSKFWQASRSVGFDPEKVQRVWCCWDVTDGDNLPAFLGEYKAETGLVVTVLRFPDEVLAALLEAPEYAH
jgi:hypothetical protein